MSDRPRIGQILLDARLIRKEDIDAALEEQRKTGRRLGEILVERSLIRDDDLNWGLASQLDIPFIRLRPEAVDAAALRVVPESLARELGVVPYFLVDNELTIVMDDPTRGDILNTLRKKTGLRLNVAIGLPEEIVRTLDEVYARDLGPGAARQAPAGDALSGDAFAAGEIQSAGRDTSGAELLGLILRRARERTAAAIHLESREAGIVVRFRVGRRIDDVACVPPGWADVLVSRIRDALSVEDATRSGEGFLRREVGGETLSYFVTIIAGRTGPSVALIDLSRVSVGENLDDLGLDADDRTALRGMTASRGALVLIAGAGRIEKLTFARLVLDDAGASRRKTFAVGRLPWIVAPDAVQIVNASIDPERLCETLAVIAEQEPDLVYVEDVWDRAAVHRVVGLASAPALVVMNVNLRTSPQALEFLANTAGGPRAASNALAGVAVLAVIPRLCPHCKQPDERAGEILRRLGASRAEMESATPMRAAACEHCSDTGYLGRHTLVEVVRMDADLSHALSDDAGAAAISAFLHKRGHVEIDGKIRRLVLSGDAAFEEYLPREGA
ncbi:hypothetical protein K8I61_13735 [bacterium]|nr:hypothetical protein [bacterium]